MVVLYAVVGVMVMALLRDYANGQNKASKKPH